MIVPEGRVGIDAECGPELLDCLHGAVGVLVGPSQQHTGQRVGGLQLDRLFQFVRRRGVLTLLQRDQSQVKVNVEMAVVEGFRTLQSLHGRPILPSLEVGESKPMLELRVLRPAGDGFTTDLRGFSQPAQLEKAQYQAAVGGKIVRSHLPGTFEAGGGAGVVVGIQRSLTASQQRVNAWRLRPGNGAGCQQPCEG